MKRDCIAFHDSNGRLNVWSLSDCLTFNVGTQGTVYSRDGRYVLVPIYSEDGLARLLTDEQACELIAGAGGAIPPDELLESVGLRARQSEKPTNKRKRRNKPKLIQASHGLAAFNRQRLADSRGMHDRRNPDSLPTHEGDH